LSRLTASYDRYRLLLALMRANGRGWPIYDLATDLANALLLVEAGELPGVT
jgi:hypothetical protein